jgi:hypothetical protein
MRQYRATSKILWCGKTPADLIIVQHFWYARGETLPAIERRLGRWHARVDQAVGPPRSSWGLDRAFGVACAGIAACLNRRPQDYGL